MPKIQQRVGKIFKNTMLMIAQTKLTTTVEKRKETHQTITPQEISIISYEELILKIKLDFVEDVQKKLRCFMLVLSRKRSKQLKQVIGQLLLLGKITIPQVVSPVDTCIIFVSEERFSKLNKCIAQFLPESEYKLLRIHKKNAPTL